MVDSFSLIILDERFDATDNEIWKIISQFWHAYQLPSNFSAFAIQEIVTDLRNIKWAKGVFFEGINLEINFVKENQKLMLLGVTKISDSPFSRRENVIGVIEVNKVNEISNIPVNVKLICRWEPFFMFFKDMANAIETEFNNKLINDVITELFKFKSDVERQTHKTIYINDKPQENIARDFLQHHLSGRSYREVPVRGGQSDLLIFTKTGRFLYETKIWRGQRNFKQGLKEIEQYILGEDCDNKLTAAFFIIFDPTKSSAARKYLGSDFTLETIANRTIRIIIININPPKPSKIKP